MLGHHWKPDRFGITEASTIEKDVQYHAVNHQLVDRWHLCDRLRRSQSVIHSITLWTCLIVCSFSLSIHASLQFVLFKTQRMFLFDHWKPRTHTQAHTDWRFERITFNKWYLPIILCAIYKRNLIFIRIDFDRSAFFMQFGCIDSVAFSFVHIQLCNCYFDWNISMKHTFFTCFLRWCSVWDLSCTWDKAFVFI